MKATRSRELLIGHALAEGTPVDAAIRGSGAPHRGADLLLVEAGRLAEGLRRMNIDEEDARLAAAWPAFLRPAQRRLATLPSPRGLQAQLLQVLVYLLGIVTVQAGLLGVLTAKVAPSLAALGAEPGAEGRFDLLLVCLAIAAPLLGVALLFVLAMPRRLPAWGRHMHRAEEACRAAALLESAAPAEARADAQRRFERLPAGFATVGELDLVRERAVADAFVAQARLVAGVRFVGLSLCVGVAAVATSTIYLILAQVSA